MKFMVNRIIHIFLILILSIWLLFIIKKRREIIKEYPLMCNWNVIIITEPLLSFVLQKQGIKSPPMDKKMNNDNTDYVSNESGTLSRLFKLPQHGTTVRTELIAGMTTF